MFLERLTKLLNGAFHRTPQYITVSVAEAQAVSQPVAALPPSRLPRHVAIIMDGNGRWAKARNLPRSAGHAAGTEALRDIIRAIQTLRKESGFDVSDRIILEIGGDDDVKAAFEQFRSMIESETLTVSSSFNAGLDVPENDFGVRLSIRKA